MFCMKVKLSFAQDAASIHPFPSKMCIFLINRTHPELAAQARAGEPSTAPAAPGPGDSWRHASQVRSSRGERRLTMSTCWHLPRAQTCTASAAFLLCTTTEGKADSLGQGLPLRQPAPLPLWLVNFPSLRLSPMRDEPVLESS